MKLLVFILTILGFLNTAYAQLNIDTAKLDSRLKEFDLTNSMVIVGEVHDVAQSH
jgi:hypothetical protein